MRLGGRVEDARTPLRVVLVRLVALARLGAGMAVEDFMALFTGIVRLESRTAIWAEKTRLDNYVRSQ